MTALLPRLDLPHLDGGSWPEWISALGSLCALVFAALAVRTAVRANKHQSKQVELLLSDQQVSRDKEERSQAELVFAWWGQRSPEKGPLIINRSGLPVYKFVATVHDFREATQTFNASVLAPLEAPTYYQELPDASRAGTFDRSEAIGQVVGIKLEFIDKSWTQWRRDIHGQLTKGDRADPYPQKPPPGGRPFDPSILDR
jgi:hypothetical protein